MKNSKTVKFCYHGLKSEIINFINAVGNEIQRKCDLSIAAKKRCLICTEKAISKNLCSIHYQREYGKIYRKFIKSKAGRKKKNNEA